MKLVAVVLGAPEARREENGGSERPVLCMYLATIEIRRFHIEGIHKGVVIQARGVSGQPSLQNP